MKSRVHVSLEVSDLKSAVSFYEKLFTQKASRTKRDYANFRLDEPGLHLALVKRPEGKAIPAKEMTGNRHYGVELFSGDDLKKWRDSAEEAGLTTRTQTGVTCCYAKADKFWARDPDGHEWEFWVRLQETEKAEDENGPGSQKEACCAPEAACC